MKILVIPDIHQHLEGIQYAENHISDFDKIVFLGDYVDDWESAKLWKDKDRNPISIIERVCNFKKANKKVKLLLGNHDLAYLSSIPANQNISGHQHNHHYDIREALVRNIDNFNIVYKIDGWLFSHAGVSMTWVNMINEKYSGVIKKVTDLNKLFHNGSWDLFDFCGGVSDYISFNGDNMGESPLWIRPSSLYYDDWGSFDDLKTYKGQVVGHTEVVVPPLITRRQDKKFLIVVDSKNHDCFFELNTRKTYKFGV